MKLSKINHIWLLFAGIVLFCNQAAGQADTLTNLKQFLYPEFTNATVKFKTGTVITAIMNFNIVTGKMVFKRNGNLLDMINSYSVDTIYLQNRKYFPFNESFLEVVDNSPIPLFIQYLGNLVSPGKQVGYGGTSETSAVSSLSSINDVSGTHNLKVPSEYKVSQKIVYWIKAYGTMHKFSNEKQFVKIFPKREAKIHQYIKENNIRINDKDDLMRLLEFCNGI